MYMIPVESSNLAAVGYNNGNLYIKFLTGVTRCYSGVPEHVFQALLDAPSKGRYHADYIKNVYPWRDC